MQHTDGFFTSQAKQQIYYQYWLPESPPMAAVLLCHGLGEHSGRYGNLVRSLVKQGYAVYALDHPGHGRSDGRRAYISRFGHYLDTLKQYADQVRQWQPELPQVLIGHSMGGLIACHYLLHYQDELSGAVLSAPAVMLPDHISPLTIRIGKLLSRTLPWAGVSKLDEEGVSRDPVVVQAYRNDPLVHHGAVTARLAAEILAAMQQVQQRAAEITLPLLLLQGSDDSMVNPAGTPALYESTGAEDKSVRIYPGLFHELFNEPEHPQVLADVTDWLAEHVSCQTAHSSSSE